MPNLTITTTTYDDLPPGVYPAEFTEFAELETGKGDAYRWVFNVIDGPHKGKSVSGLSDAERPPTTKDKTGRWLAALSGLPLKEGVSVDPDGYIGKRYTLILEAKDGGGSKLNTFMPEG